MNQREHIQACLNETAFLPQEKIIVITENSIYLHPQMRWHRSSTG